MFNAARYVLNNNRTTLVLYAIVLLTGYKTYNTIGRLEYPEFTIRNAQVITSYPGRTAEQVEEKVTDPIEQAVRQMPEVKSISSTSKPGLSIVSVELEETYFDLDPIWTDLRNRVSGTKMPDGARTPEVNDDVGDVYPYVYALRGDGYTDKELLEYAELIQDELLATPGVAKVDFHGVQEERVYMEYSPGEFAAYGVSPASIANELSKQNNVSSSGNVKVGPERINMITRGEFESLQEIADYPLTTPGESASIRVSDGFDIYRDYQQPPTSFAHYQGERVISIAVSMVKGGVVTAIGETIQKRLDEVEATLPHGLHIETMFFQPVYVDKSIKAFVSNLAQAFFFVLVVMLAFAGFRIALIVGVLVPSAVLMCFTFMPTLGVQLEMMSIAALIIALGLLVDNAVVVSEQILVRLGQGDDREDAVISAVSNLTIPLLAASGTTIAAFSPIALAAGAVSEFTYSLFAVVTLTLLSSWVLSITVIPLFCYYFLKPLKKDTFIGGLLTRGYGPYERALRLALGKGWIFPILIFAMTFGAAKGFKYIPNIFFPPNERSQFVVDVELPLGTDIIETEKEVLKLQNWLMEELGDELELVTGWVGNGGPRWYLSLASEPTNPNYGFLNILTKSDKPVDVRRLVETVNREAILLLPDARVTAKVLENGPPVGDPIQIRLYGKEMTTLYDLRDRIVSLLGDVDGMYDLRDNWGVWTKQLSIDPDPERAARVGLTSGVIADAINMQFTGTQVSQFRDGTDAIPIIMRATEEYRLHPERLEDLPVYSTSSGVVPLGSLADIDLEFLPGSILRENTLRVMTIKGRVQGRFVSEALAEASPLLSTLTNSDEWPAGYYIEFGGEQEDSGEANSSIGAAMPISMSILSLILIAQFNSLRRFGIIMLTIPPMLIGVVPGLIATGSSFGFMTLLGLIALLGIIVNNAILLIDEIDAQRDLGLELKEAIVAAAKSRLRPIIMTTTTTIIGLTPLALFGGDMWNSMAYAMMFGLGFATLLTLVLCPVLYYRLFLRDEKKSKRSQNS